MEEFVESFSDWGPVAGVVMMIIGFIGVLATLIVDGCFRCS